MTGYIARLAEIAVLLFLGIALGVLGLSLHETFGG
jgi:hypothetical protein